MDGWGAFSGVLQSASKQWEQIEAQLDQAVGVEADPHAEITSGAASAGQDSPAQLPRPVHIAQGDSIPFDIPPSSPSFQEVAVVGGDGGTGADTGSSQAEPSDPNPALERVASTAELSSKHSTTQIDADNKGAVAAGLSAPASQETPRVAGLPASATLDSRQREQQAAKPASPEGASHNTQQASSTHSPDNSTAAVAVMPLVLPATPPSDKMAPPSLPQQSTAHDTGHNAAEDSNTSDTMQAGTPTGIASGSPSVATPAAVRAKMAKAKEVIAALKSRCAALGTQVKRREDQLAAASQQCAAALTETADCREQLTAALQRAKRAEAKALSSGESEEELQRLRAECAEQKEALDSFRSEGEQLSKKQAVQEGTIRGLRSKLKEAEASTNKEHEEAAKAAAKLQEVEQQLREATSASKTAHAAGSQAAKLQLALERSRSEVASLEAALAAARDEGAAYQSQVAAALEDMEEADAARDALAGQLAAAQRALKLAQTEADAQRSTARSLRSELAQVRAEAHSAEAEWRAEIETALAASDAARFRLRNSEAAQLAGAEPAGSDSEEEGGAEHSSHQGGLLAQLAASRARTVAALQEADALQARLSEVQKEHRSEVQHLGHELAALRADKHELQIRSTSLGDELQQQSAACTALSDRLQQEQSARGTAAAAMAVAESQRDAALAEVASLRVRLQTAKQAAEAARHTPPAHIVGGSAKQAAEAARHTPPAHIVGGSSDTTHTPSPDAAHLSASGGQRESPAEKSARQLSETAASAAEALTGTGAVLTHRDEAPIVTRLAQLLDRAQVQGLLRSELNEELQRQAALVASLRGALDTAQGEAHRLQVQVTGASELLRSAESLAGRARTAEGRAAVLLELLGEKQEEVECLQGELADVKAAFKQQMVDMMQHGADGT